VGGAVYALVALAFVAFTESFVDHAHYPAAVGMFACIVGVAVINALRHRGHRLSEVTGARDKTRAVAGAVFSRDPYGLVAVAMVAVVAFGVPLTLAGTFEDTVFWVEAALILLFAAFWVTQTKELWDPGQPDR
jgi:hypothetical protein